MNKKELKNLYPSLYRLALFIMGAARKMGLPHVRGRLHKSREISKWKKQGRPLPPPHSYKQQVLRFYAKKFRLRTFVETGTLFGDMIDAMRGHFDKIYSIEISHDLFDRACSKYSNANDVELICGDSAKEIEPLIERINAPALFWLDGHFSGGITGRGDVETPILEELRSIMAAGNQQSVIVIDDARNFGTNPAYPSIQSVKDLVKTSPGSFDINVCDDSIRIYPVKNRK